MPIRALPDAAHSASPRRIVVPLDRSALAERALAPAAEIARRTGATIRLVHVRPSETGGEAALADAREYLDTVAARLRSWTGTEVESATLRGRVAPAIRADAAAVDADLVVMSTHGLTGWRRLWLGSVADALLHRSRIPVLLVRASGASALFAPRRVLVPLDGAAECERVLRVVAGILGPFEPTVHLLEVVAPMPLAAQVLPFGAPAIAADHEATAATLGLARRWLARAAGRLAAYRPGIDIVTTAVVDEPAASAIVSAARAVELVVIGSHDPGIARLVAGSVRDDLLRATTAMLLVVPTSPARERPADAPRVGKVLTEYPASLG